MSITGICAAVIVAVLLITTIRQHRPELALLLALAAGTGLFLTAIYTVSPVFSTLKNLFEGSGNTQYYTLLLKALGICLVTRFASGFCTDSGNSSLAEKIGLVGRCAVVLLALPLITDIVGFAGELVNRR